MIDSYLMRQAGSEPTVYTVDEEAREMKISRKHLYVLIGKKKGPPVKRFGNRIRIPVLAFSRWLNKP